MNKDFFATTLVIGPTHCSLNPDHILSSSTTSPNFSDRTATTIFEPPWLDLWSDYSYFLLSELLVHIASVVFILSSLSHLSIYFNGAFAFLLRLRKPRFISPSNNCGALVLGGLALISL
jgi:hypothetical protein